MNTISSGSFSAFYNPAVDSQRAASSTQPIGAGESSDSVSFGDALNNAVKGVEQLHTSAQEQVVQLAQGDRQDIHNVMIAVEKADVAFQLMMQVRNKIVNAYQEVSKMQF